MYLKLKETTFMLEFQTISGADDQMQHSKSNANMKFGTTDVSLIEIGKSKMVVISLKMAAKSTSETLQLILLSMKWVQLINLIGLGINFYVLSHIDRFSSFQNPRDLYS